MIRKTKPKPPVEEKPNDYSTSFVIESPYYADLFDKFLPGNFTPAHGLKKHNISGFVLNKYDLLTTLSAKNLESISSFPLFEFLRHLFVWKALFIGSTITEFCPLNFSKLEKFPAEDTSNKTTSLQNFFDLLDTIAEEKDIKINIIKDLPDIVKDTNEVPFVEAENFEYLQHFEKFAKANDYFKISGQALAYVPITFKSIDEWLNTRSSSRKQDLKRKFKKQDELIIKTLPIGNNYFADESFLANFYELYEEVFKQSEVHFDKLTYEFFKGFLCNKNIRGEVFLYYTKEDKPELKNNLLGVNICLIENNILIDKYIAMSYPLAREYNLYFVSWKVNLEYAIENKLKYYIAGWTDPKVKASLGAKFTQTCHYVKIISPITRMLFSPFKSYFEGDKNTLENLKK